MNLTAQIKESLKLGNHCSNLDNNAFKKLVENSFVVLTGGDKVHASINSSKLDVVKQIFAAFLKIGAEFARHNFTKENVSRFLQDECGYGSGRAEIFSEFYQQHKIKLEIALGNIGTHLPHVTDVHWKIDYIIKSSCVNEAGGPIFRICLVADSSGKTERINFSCDSLQLQDLIYKLKDAVRHCQKLSVEH